MPDTHSLMCHVLMCVSEYGMCYVLMCVSEYGIQLSNGCNSNGVMAVIMTAMAEWGLLGGGATNLATSPI